MISTVWFGYNTHLLLIGARYLHSSGVSHGQARVMNKFMTKPSKKKHYYNEAPILPSAESFSKGAFEGKKSQSSKRVTVLNKLFMKHISDLMATGESAEKFANLGIEINRVKVTPDFKLVQVFWGAKGTQTDDVISSLLSKNAGAIRNELTQLRVIGLVPKIMFCKDKQLTQLIELEKRLEKADFGDDYVCPDPVAKLKNQLELNIALDPNTKRKILEVDSSIDAEYEDSIPEMPQNIFGLNHADIMSKIVKALKKAETKQTINYTEASDSAIHNPEYIQSIPLEENLSAKDELKQFLLKRKLLRFKARKEAKNLTPDLEYINSELEERCIQHFSNDFYDSEDEDFIEEDT